MSFNLFRTKPGRILALACLSAALVLATSSCISPTTMTGGCAGPASQGWSGFASYDGILYLGSMDGKVLAINPSARDAGRQFPDSGEWVYAVKAPVATGGMSCAPASASASLYGTPAVSENLVYVGTSVGNSGQAVGINRLSPGHEGGAPLRSRGEWIYPGETKSIGAVVGSLTMADGVLYFGSSDGKAYALDAVYGEKIWEFETDGKIWTSPAVGDGVVYIGGHDGSLYALSAQDGGLLWKTELSAACASSPTVSGDSVFVGTFDNRLYAIRAADGSPRWEFEGENWFWTQPVIEGDSIYAGCLDHNIYALRTTTGEELWHFTADSPIVSTPVLMGDLLAVVSEAGEMYILESASGTLQRTVSIGFQVMAPLYAEENLVFVHARNHFVYCIDAQRGRVVWELDSIIEQD